VRTRFLPILVLAVTAAAQTRLTNENVSVTAPQGWRSLTRAELGGVTPQPLVALIRISDHASFQIVKSQLPQTGATPKQIAAASMALLLLEMNHGEVDVPLHETMLSGLPAAEWTATYTIAKGADGHARLISVVSGDVSYVIAASGPAAAQGDLEALVKSVVIAR